MRGTTKPFPPPNRGRRKSFSCGRTDVVLGRNAVTELLKSGREVETVYIQKGR